MYNNGRNSWTLDWQWTFWQWPQHVWILRQWNIVIFNIICWTSRVSIWWEALTCAPRFSGGLIQYFIHERLPSSLGVNNIQVWNTLAIAFAVEVFFSLHRNLKTAVPSWLMLFLCYTIMVLNVGNELVMTFPLSSVRHWALIMALSFSRWRNMSSKG